MQSKSATLSPIWPHSVNIRHDWGNLFNENGLQNLSKPWVKGRMSLLHRSKQTVSRKVTSMAATDVKASTAQQLKASCQKFKPTVTGRNNIQGNQKHNRKQPTHQCRAAEQKEIKKASPHPIRLDQLKINVHEDEISVHFCMCIFLKHQSMKIYVHIHARMCESAYRHTHMRIDNENSINDSMQMKRKQ